jgi:7-cyano-7-deazaguanine reductase
LILRPYGPPEGAPLKTATFPNRALSFEAAPFEAARVGIYHQRFDADIEVAVTISGMPKQPGYTADHAVAGLDAKFPEIETWPNQFPGYEIVIDDPEFTSVCPKTGLPDFGKITIRYMPRNLCLELKSLKEYLQSYRNLGIFQENIVNRVLEDVVRWAKPVWAEVKGDFRPRGGISTVVIAKWPRGKGR